MDFFLSSFFYFLAIINRILRRYLNSIIIQSDQDPCQHTKIMDTIEYMNEQEQFREGPAEIVRMHRVILIYSNAIGAHRYTRKRLFCINV